MSKATGYSLWLVPEIKAKEYHLLVKTINKIANKHQTPNFIPHVTLLGGINGSEEDVLNKTKRLAEIITPFEIQFSEIGSNGIYFQILFYKIEQTKVVMDVNVLAQEVFTVNKGQYFPHSSIAYGNFSTESVDAIKQQLAEQSDSITGKKFITKGIELWRTEGEVKDWYKVAYFSFKN